MSDERFPLTEAAGIKVYHIVSMPGADPISPKIWVCARDVEAYLASLDRRLDNLERKAAAPSGGFFSPLDFKEIGDRIGVGWAEVAAIDANRLLLERGQRVYGVMVQGETRDEWQWCDSPPNLQVDTHSGLLVAVTPIAQESALDLLRELIARNDAGEPDREIVRDIHTRARALLQRGSK